MQRQHEVNFQHFRPRHSLWDWLKLTIHQLDLPCTSTPCELRFESSSFTFHTSWYKTAPAGKVHHLHWGFVLPGLWPLPLPRMQRKPKVITPKSLTFKACQYISWRSREEQTGCLVEGRRFLREEFAKSIFSAQWTTLIYVSFSSAMPELRCWGTDPSQLSIWEYHGLTPASS